MNEHDSEWIKRTYNHIASVFILVEIKADLRSNSELLEVNLTQKSAKIKVMDGCAYPEFRLFRYANLIPWSWVNWATVLKAILSD